MAESLRRARPDQKFCVAPGESCCPAVHVPLDRRGTQLPQCLGAARTSLCGGEPGSCADSFRLHPLQRENQPKPSSKIELTFVLRALAARRYASGHIIVLQFRLAQAEAQLAAGGVAAALAALAELAELAELEPILAEPEQPGSSAIRAQAREFLPAALERRR